jgi:hypothetical protein
MTSYLLDVNVLIALIDPAHIQHDKAHTWFATTGQHAWATCPLTENGVLSIVGNSREPFGQTLEGCGSSAWNHCYKLDIKYLNCKQPKGEAQILSTEMQW